MPTETFFNLSKEKQGRIMAAAKKEFSRVSLKEASIANVIREAEIPRGSFYQYFDGIEDLYYYYFHMIGHDSYQVLIEAVEATNGDLFAAFEQYFSAAIVEIFKGENVRFYNNLFMSMDYHGLHKVAPHLDENAPEPKKVPCHKKKVGKMAQKKLLAVVDKSLLDVKDDRELSLLIQMMMHTVFTTVADGYRHLKKNEDYDVNWIRQTFTRKLNWLKNGAAKNQ